MAWIIGGNSEYFGLEKMQPNAEMVWNFYGSKGWTINAVAGLLGNMQRESTLNPALIEIGGTGHGLVQWTPPTDLYNVLDVLYGGHSDWENPNKQCNVIYAEFEESTGLAHRGIEPQWYKRGQYQYSWDEWASSTDLPGTLALAFCWEYERPGVPAEQERVENANYWYTYLSGKAPIPTGGKKMPFIYYLRRIL